MIQFMFILSVYTNLQYYGFILYHMRQYYIVSHDTNMFYIHVVVYYTISCEATHWQAIQRNDTFLRFSYFLIK